MLSLNTTGDWSDTLGFLRSAIDPKIWQILDRYGREGVALLSANTPVDSGTTSSSWGYDIRRSGDKYYIYWTNDNIVDGVPVAILIQYGHATRNGGYVSGTDFINPAMAGVFRQMADDAWAEVASA